MNGNSSSKLKFSFDQHTKVDKSNTMYSMYQKGKFSFKKKTQAFFFWIERKTISGILKIGQIL